MLQRNRTRRGSQAGVKEPSPNHSPRPAELPPGLSGQQCKNTLLEQAHSARDHRTRGPSTAPASQQASPWAQTRWMRGTGRASCRLGPEAATHTTVPHATGLSKPLPSQPPCSLEVQATPLEAERLGWGGTSSAGGAESRRIGPTGARTTFICELHS